MIEHTDFFSWFLNVKDLVLSNGFKQVRIVIQWLKNSFFSKKLQKSSSGWGSCGLRLGIRPQTPSVLGLSYTSLLNAFPNSNIFLF